MALTPEQIAQMDILSGLSSDKFAEMDAVAFGGSNAPNKQSKTNKGYQRIDYSDIKNNPNLSKDEKIKAMQKRLKDENARLDRENALKTAKMVGGWALNAASWGIPVGGGLKAATALVKAGRPVAGRVVGTIFKNTPGLAASGAIGGLGNAMLEDATDIKDYLKSIGVNTAVNVGAGKGLQALGKGGYALLNSDAIKKGLPKIQELLNSVPAEYSERALRKELAGDSIFKGKFNAKDLNENYRAAGEKAIAGLNDAAAKANAEIENALSSLPEGSLNPPQLITRIIKDIDKYSHGGRTNPALDQKGNDILSYLNELNNPGNKTVDFHNIKSNIQTQLRNQYGQDSGDGINALKGMGAKIREELNNISPEYAEANAARENLFNIKSLLGGLDKKTVASRLRNVEGDAAIRSGYNQAANELDNIVAPEYKFMDDVNDLRAREALEKWFPGQWGGSGTSQGGANILRTILGGSALWSHNPAIIGLFSPKISGKTAIQGVGLLNKGAKKLNNFYDNVIEKYILNAGSRTLSAPKNPVSAGEES